MPEELADGYYWALHMVDGIKPEGEEWEVIEVHGGLISRTGSDFYHGREEFVKIGPRLSPPVMFNA